MSEQDVDDVAFLTAGSDTGLQRDVRQERSYERDGFVIECSRKKAMLFIFIGFVSLISIALIIAFARPIDDCPCDVKRFENETDTYGKSKQPLSTTGEVFPWDNIRLPTFAQPFRYNITIHPNLTTSKIRGHITIELQVTENTKFIVFHSSGLTITERLVQENRKGPKQKIARFLECPGREQVYLELEGTFRQKLNYTVHLKYYTKFSEDLEGFYVSSYNTSAGDTRYVAATHFEPTFARTAFPCFDEPQFKARFKVSLYRDRFHIALCNMPVVNTEEAGFFLGTSILRDDFEESVEMSTYLVAFVVCDFKRTTSKTNKNIHVYAAEHMLPQAAYATKIASDIMVYYESFFGIPYPLPKQDMIAIPNFAAGAMENWGLITFREVAVLLDPEETSVEIKMGVSVIIAHELAHQWFGNLVTMKWWNDLWLNEGAASFFESKAMDHLAPEWRIMDTFVIFKTQPALQSDAFASSHPIDVPVGDPNEIESIFDSISYNKGSAILYMLEEFLGKEIFKAGLNDYLNSHAYGNADTNDLWSAFSKVMNNTYDVKAIMDTWTQQMGYPVVIIGYRDNIMHLSQSRFLISPQKNATNILQPTSPFDYKWYIPVTYYTDKEPHKIRKAWLNMSTVDILEMPYDLKYIKCNVNQTGFYRVNYTDGMWTEIILALMNDHTRFSPADRANLIDDAFSLNDAGMLHVRIPLRLSLYLVRERDYVPWETAQTLLHSWRRRLSEHSIYKTFTTFFKNLLRPVIKYVGWGDEGSYLKKLLRNSVIRSAVMLGMDDVLMPVKSSFQQWMAKGTPIPSDVRDIAYGIGIKYGDEKAWFHCWKVYQKTTSPSEKYILLSALSATTDPWLLRRFLIFSLNRDLIRTQDIGIVIKDIATNENGRYLAWRHIKANWPEMVDLFGNGTYAMIELLATVIINFYTEYDYREVTEFFKQVNIDTSVRTMEQSLEMVKFNIYWVQNNGDQVEEWLDSDDNVFGSGDRTIKMG